MNSESNEMMQEYNKKTPDISIRTLITDLGSKNGLVREMARETLVAMGRPAVDYLAELLNDPDDIVRWECVKALGSIADPASAPLLVLAMSDANDQVRWLAAEGLIAIGTAAVGPVLEEFLCDPKSLSIQKGVRHFFIGLSSSIKMNEFYDLISALNKRERELYAPAIAYRILKKFGRSKEKSSFCDRDARDKVMAA